MNAFILCCTFPNWKHCSGHSGGPTKTRTGATGPTDGCLLPIPRPIVPFLLSRLSVYASNNLVVPPSPHPHAAAHVLTAVSSSSSIATTSTSDFSTPNPSTPDLSTPAPSTPDRPIDPPRRARRRLHIQYEDDVNPGADVFATTVGVPAFHAAIPPTVRIMEEGFDAADEVRGPAKRDGFS